MVTLQRSAVALDGRVLFRTRGVLDGLAPSPDGRWLLVGRPSAGGWLYIGTGPGEVRLTVGDVSRSFEPSGLAAAGFPVPRGWCCVR